MLVTPIGSGTLGRLNFLQKRILGAEKQGHKKRGRPLKNYNSHTTATYILLGIIPPPPPLNKLTKNERYYYKQHGFQNRRAGRRKRPTWSKAVIVTTIRLLNQEGYSLSTVSLKKNKKTAFEKAAELCKLPSDWVARDIWKRYRREFGDI
jgi:hypothetical protein